MRGDIYIAAHLRRCLRHSVFSHVLQYTPSTSVLDALHLHHAIKSPPLRYPSPLHITFIEVKNELVKMKDVFPMKVITHTITHTAKFAGGQIESKMYPEKFAGGRSRLDLLLPSFLPSREEKKIQDQKNRPLGCRAQKHTSFIHLGRDEQRKQDQKNRPLGSRGVLHTPHTDRVRIETKKQDRIFCPLRGHSVGRMRYAPTTCRQETLSPINSRKERTETKIQDQKNRPLGNGAEWHTPHMDRVRTETKTQDRIFFPLRGHVVGRMQYAPTTYRQKTLFPINSREERTETKMQEQKNRPLGSRAQKHTPHTDRVRTETKMQERRKQSIDSGAEWHTPFMRQGERDAVWRDTFLEQRARIAIWRDRRLEEKCSHARLQLSTFRENSKPYKSSLVALSEQLRDIFAA